MTFGVLAATSSSVNNVEPGVLGFLVVAGIGVVLVFLLMVALYNSYRSPLIILFSVPVAAFGALIRPAMPE